MAEQIPLSFKGPLQDAIASDMLQDEAGNQGQDRTMTPPAKTEDLGGRVDRPSSNASRQLAAALLLEEVVQVLLQSFELKDPARATLLSRLAILKGLSRAK